MSCPSFTELCAADATTALRDHLDECPRCRAIVSRVTASEPSVASADIPAPPKGGLSPQRGGAWAFWSPTSDEYLVGAVVEASSTDLLIVPLLSEICWATENDVLIPADVLGYPALAPIWSVNHVLVEQAVEPVDMLPEEALAFLGEAYDAFRAGEPLSEPGGPPVRGEEDPRIAAHAALADDLRPVFEPWAELQVAEELGPVVAQARANRDIEVDALGIEDVGVEVKTWLDFEAGRLDPHAAIPARGMVKALQKLGILLSRRVLELARQSVRGSYKGDGSTSAPAMARRRRGVTHVARRDAAAADAAAESYAQALAREVGS